MRMGNTGIAMANWLHKPHILTVKQSNGVVELQQQLPFNTCFDAALYRKDITGYQHACPVDVGQTCIRNSCSCCA